MADGGTFVENGLPTISQDAKLVLTPNAYKAGKLYSAVPNDGTGDFTVDRNSTATYIGQDGLIKTALANVPRIDWTTGVPVILRGLQRTNLIEYSEDFSNAAYVTKINPIYNILDHEGGFTAINVTSDTANQNVFRHDNIVIDDGLIYTSSVYVKRVTGSGTILMANILNIIVDITSQVLDDGKYHKVEVIRLSNRTDAFFYILLDTIGDSIDICFCQLEQGSTASSYIPTNGTTVTRLADNISVTTPAGVTSITETIDGVEQTPITTIPATYSLPVGNINKVKML